MSTRDPAGRIPRRRWFLSAARAALWSVSGVSVFAAAVAVTAEGHRSPDWWVYTAPTVAVMSALTVSFTDVNSRDAARRSATPVRFLLWTLGLWLACTGVGVGVGFVVRDGADAFPAALPIPAALTVAGLALLVVASRVRAARLARLRRSRSVRLTGPRVRGVVTETRDSRIHNVFRFTRVTIRFEDGQGRSRWHEVTRWAQPPVGTRCWVRYDPEHPGRRSTIFVEWTDT